MDKQPLVIEQRIRYKLRRFKRAIAALNRLMPV